MNTFTKTLKELIYIDNAMMAISSTAMQKTVTKFIKF